MRPDVAYYDLAEEARSMAEDAARHQLVHPLDCGCRSCIADHMDEIDRDER